MLYISLKFGYDLTIWHDFPSVWYYTYVCILVRLLLIRSITYLLPHLLFYWYHCHELIVMKFEVFCSVFLRRRIKTVPIVNRKNIIVCYFYVVYNAKPQPVHHIYNLKSYQVNIIFIVYIYIVWINDIQITLYKSL